jgi:hypothetical protein
MSILDGLGIGETLENRRQAGIRIGSVSVAKGDAGT